MYIRIPNKIKNNILYILPHKIAHSYIYWSFHKAILNWNNPQLYDEKIHWLLTYRYNETYGKYVDKYWVRFYVERCGLKNLLIPLIGVFNKPEDINYEILPEQFILKATHGSGENFYEICYDRNRLNTKRINQKFRKALKANFARQQCEYPYNSVQPRIICEVLLEDKRDIRITDYKVVCTNGKPRCILVCTNRDEGRDYYSTDWQYLEFVKKESRSKVKTEKPQCLAEMLRDAAILSKPFPLARIDFYVVDKKLYFGEITLSPAGGNHDYLSIYGQRELGQMVDLSRQG